MHFYVLSANQIKRLTGCSAYLVARLVALLPHSDSMRGRPRKYSDFIATLVTLTKLRHNLDYLALETVCGVDSVTASRMVIRITSALANVSLPTASTKACAVDTTTVRVNGSKKELYSGHKHHKGLKAQIVVDTQGTILDIAPSEPASAHDKTIWNKNYNRLQCLFNKLFVADKAYAGAKGENVFLFRPVKKCEKLYAQESVKLGNRELSRLRIKVENVIGSLKRFKIIRDIFGLAHKRFDACVKTVALIHNLEQKVA